MKLEAKSRLTATATPVTALASGDIVQFLKSAKVPPALIKKVTENATKESGRSFESEASAEDLNALSKALTKSLGDPDRTGGSGTSRQKIVWAMGRAGKAMIFVDPKTGMGTFRFGM